MFNPERTTFTDEPIKRETCTGKGAPADGEQFGNAICPVCRGIAQVTDGKIDPHTVRVI